MKAFYSVLLLIILLHFRSCVYSASISCPISQFEYDGLQALFTATLGSDWNWNWNMPSASRWTFPSSLATPCTNAWQGLVCKLETSSPGNCSITSLHLGGHGLVGTLPEELFLLTALETLILSKNMLTSTIPSTISSMSNLNYFFADGNTLTGPLPNLGNHSTLLQIDLFDNFLSGKISENLFNLCCLSVIKLYNNHLSGTIPWPHSAMSTQIQQIFLASNFLTGLIPSQLEAIPFLSILRLGGNYLTGSLTSELGSCSVVEELELSYNILPGSIPNALGNAMSLFLIDLRVNDLTGTVPSDIFLMMNISELYLSSNLLTGSIPSALGGCDMLMALEISYNFISGTLPDTSQNSMMSVINLFNTFLTGTIPDSLQGLQMLKILYVYDCYLTGSLPSALGALSRLEYLSFAFNFLVGTVSNMLASQWTFLRQLDLTANLFTGTLPFRFRKDMTYLYLGNNALVGTIPGEFNELRFLRFLILNNNLLTGSIPASMGFNSSQASCVSDCSVNFGSIFQLDFSSNELKGTLPEQLGQLQNLTFLSISNNLLSGTLPSSLRQLHLLQTLNVSSNTFTGSLDNIFGANLPEGLTFPHLNYLDVSNNSFGGTMPVSIFYHSNLQVVLLYSNCLMGTIPQSVCNATTIEVLNMDALSSGSRCDVFMPKFLQPFILGRFPRHLVHGTIPSCLFSHSAIEVLHLAGNALTGTLPELLNVSLKNLKSLSVAYNRIVGTIPLSLQMSGEFHQLALSFNRLTGTLSDKFNLSNRTKQLKLEVNRLSGDIPNSFMRATSPMNVLSGNTFSCSSDMPPMDADFAPYTCGSSTLDNALCSLSAVMCFVIVVVVICIGLVKYHHADRSVLASSSMLQNFSAICVRIFERNLKWYQMSFRDDLFPIRIGDFLQKLDIACKGSLLICGGYICFCLPAFVLLKTNFTADNSDTSYSDRYFQYGWIISAAQMCGGISVSFLLVVVTFSMWMFAVSLSSARQRADMPMVQERSVSRILILPMQTKILDNIVDKSISMWVALWVQYTILAAVFHGINFCATVGVNISYVYFIVQGGYSPTVLYLLQAFMGFAKMLWGFLYIPNAIILLSRVSLKHALTHQIVMYIVTFFVGPFIAMMLTDSSCFYNAIYGMPSVTFSYLADNKVLQCTGQMIMETGSQILSDHTFAFCAFSNVEVPSGNIITPPWLYRYQCGSSIIVTYIPVLLFMFIMQGVLVPFSMLGMVQQPWNEALTRCIPSWLNKLLISKGIYSIDFAVDSSSTDRSSSDVHDDQVSFDSLFHGESIVAKLMLDFAVLLTFGLAFPLLALVILIAILGYATTWRILIGRALAFGGGNDLRMFRRLEVSMRITQEEAHLAMLIIIGVTCCFWSLICFDMVADSYGEGSGLLTVILIMTLIPASLLLLSYRKQLLQQLNRFISPSDNSSDQLPPTVTVSPCVSITCISNGLEQNFTPSSSEMFGLELQSIESEENL